MNPLQNNKGVQKHTPYYNVQYSVQKFLVAKSLIDSD